MFAFCPCSLLFPVRLFEHVSSHDHAGWICLHRAGCRARPGFRIRAGTGATVVSERAAVSQNRHRLSNDDLGPVPRNGIGFVPLLRSRRQADTMEHSAVACSKVQMTRCVVYRPLTFTTSGTVIVTVSENFSIVNGCKAIRKIPDVASFGIFPMILPKPSQASSTILLPQVRLTDAVPFGSSLRYRSTISANLFDSRA
jgi:hypothetical protein